MRKYILALVAFAALALPAAASANFAAAGPTAPLGFPSYYEDSTGLQVGLCIEDPGCPASPPLADMVGPDGEAFYQLANATLTPNVEGRDGEIVVDFNVEAAFLDADPITFGRIQFSAKNLVPNATYTVNHPYGTSTFTVDGSGNLAGGLRGQQREEVGCAVAPCDFTVAFGSTIGPFLRSTSAPAGYLGNGVTETTVTGGSVRNVVNVSGPGLPPAITDELGQIVTPAGVTTDKFVVEGKLFDPTAPLPPAPVPVEPDTDGDGVPDIIDQCKFQIGTVANNGCPAPPPGDADHDGVADDKDQCPNTPAGTVVLSTGCPVPKVDPTPPVIVRETNTVVQHVPGVNTVVQQVPVLVHTTPLAPSRVGGLRIKKGVLRAVAPANATTIRIVVRKGRRTVRRIVLEVSPGKAFKARLTRKRGRYTVVVKAGNEQGSALVFGAAAIRSFGVR
jgi:hypothetical protein